MAIKYLKVTTDEAYKALDNLVVKGYDLANLMISQNDAAAGNPEEKTIAEWREKYKEWFTEGYTTLVMLYESKRQALTFQHKTVMSTSVTGRNQTCTDLTAHIETRTTLLQNYLVTLTNRFQIVFQAGRDNNVQLGGTENKQEVTNE